MMRASPVQRARSGQRRRALRERRIDVPRGRRCGHDCLCRVDAPLARAGVHPRRVSSCATAGRTSMDLRRAQRLRTGRLKGVHRFRRAQAARARPGDYAGDLRVDGFSRADGDARSEPGVAVALQGRSDRTVGHVSAGGAGEGNEALMVPQGGHLARRVGCSWPRIGLRPSRRLRGDGHHGGAQMNSWRRILVAAPAVRMPCITYDLLVKVRPWELGSSPT